MHDKCLVAFLTVEFLAFRAGDVAFAAKVWKVGKLPVRPNRSIL